jgi:hypothetical protein
MADLGGQFNSNEVEDRQDFSPLPAGDYKAICIDSKWKDAKTAGNKYIELTFEIVGDKAKGRKVWSRLNLVNSNTTAVEIARSELKEICQATGVLTPRDTAELHNRPLVLELKLTKRKDNGEFTNEIKKYKSVSSAASKPADPAPAQAESRCHLLCKCRSLKWSCVIISAKPSTQPTSI